MPDGRLNAQGAGESVDRRCLGGLQAGIDFPSDDAFNLAQAIVMDFGARRGGGPAWTAAAPATPAAARIAGLEITLFIDIAILEFRTGTAPFARSDFTAFPMAADQFDLAPLAFLFSPWQCNSLL